MIPEAAVEAAAEVMYDAFGWEEGSLDKVARAILEASAPFMPIRHMSNEDLHHMGINRCPGCVSRKVSK